MNTRLRNEEISELSTLRIRELHQAISKGNEKHLRNLLKIHYECITNRTEAMRYLSELEILVLAYYLQTQHKKAVLQIIQFILSQGISTYASALNMWSIRLIIQPENKLFSTQITALLNANAFTALDDMCYFTKKRLYQYVILLYEREEFFSAKEIFSALIKLLGTNNCAYKINTCIANVLEIDSANEVNHLALKEAIIQLDKEMKPHHAQVMQQEIATLKYPLTTTENILYSLWLTQLNFLWKNLVRENNLPLAFLCFELAFILTNNNDRDRNALFNSFQTELKKIATTQDKKDMLNKHLETAARNKLKENPHSTLARIFLGTARLFMPIKLSKLFIGKASPELEFLCNISIGNITTDQEPQLKRRKC